MEEQPNAEETAQQEPVDIQTLVLWTIGQFEAHAWVALGLWKDPVTGELRKNLPQARIAIDCVTALAEVIKPHVSEAQRRELERLVTDLRLNFVQRSVGESDAAQG